MLKENLYTILSIVFNDQLLQVEVKLKADHPIFDGHFPDVPVLPGVIMMQMVKELMEEQEGKSLRIKKVVNMKFLQKLFKPLLKHCLSFFSNALFFIYSEKNLHCHPKNMHNNTH